METPPAFDFAKEVVTQILTLTTAVIGVSATFVKELDSNRCKWAKRWLYAAWFCFLVAMLVGILSLGSMAGLLQKATEATPPDIYAGGLRCMAGAEVFFFFLGLMFLIIHAGKRIAKT